MIRQDREQGRLVLMDERGGMLYLVFDISNKPVLAIDTIRLGDHDPKEFSARVAVHSGKKGDVPILTRELDAKWHPPDGSAYVELVLPTPPPELRDVNFMRLSASVRRWEHES
jgi:hypothetical protein